MGLIPAHLEMVNQAGRLSLRGIDADVVLVDTPPDTQSLEVRAALASTDFVLAPVLPEPFGCQAIASVPKLIRQAVQAGNVNLSLLGFVVSQRRRLAVHTAFEQIIRRVHGDAVFGTVIECLAAYKEAITANQPITSYQVSGKRAQEPIDKAAGAIRSLVSEIESRIETHFARRVAA